MSSTELLDVPTLTSLLINAGIVAEKAAVYADSLIENDITTRELILFVDNPSMREMGIKSLGHMAMIRSIAAPGDDSIGASSVTKSGGGGAAVTPMPAPSPTVRPKQSSEPPPPVPVTNGRARAGARSSKTDEERTAEAAAKAEAAAAEVLASGKIARRARSPSPPRPVVRKRSRSPPGRAAAPQPLKPVKPRGIVSPTPPGAKPAKPRGSVTPTAGASATGRTKSPPAPPGGGGSRAKSPGMPGAGSRTKSPGPPTPSSRAKSPGLPPKPRPKSPGLALSKTPPKPGAKPSPRAGSRALSPTQNSFSVKKNDGSGGGGGGDVLASRSDLASQLNATLKKPPPKSKSTTNVQSGLTMPSSSADADEDAEESKKMKMNLFRRKSADPNVERERAAEAARKKEEKERAKEEKARQKEEKARLKEEKARQKAAEKAAKKSTKSSGGDDAGGSDDGDGDGADEDPYALPTSADPYELPTTVSPAARAKSPPPPVPKVAKPKLTSPKPAPNKPATSSLGVSSPSSTTAAAGSDEEGDGNDFPAVTSGGGEGSTLSPPSGTAAPPRGSSRIASSTPTANHQPTYEQLNEAQNKVLGLAEDGSQILVQGFLNKKGIKTTANLWKPRHCVLTKTFFRYTDVKKGASDSKQVPVQDIVYCKPVTSSGLRSNCIEIQTANNKLLYFQAESGEEYIEWMGHMNKVIAANAPAQDVRDEHGLPVNQAKGAASGAGSASGAGGGSGTGGGDGASETMNVSSPGGAFDFGDYDGRGSIAEVDAVMVEAEASTRKKGDANKTSNGTGGGAGEGGGDAPAPAPETAEDFDEILAAKAAELAAERAEMAQIKAEMGAASSAPVDEPVYVEQKAPEKKGASNVLDLDSNTLILHQGILTKSKWSGKWHKRFCLLCDNRFVYTDRRAKNSKTVMLADIEYFGPNTSSSFQRANCLEMMVGGGKSHYWAAENGDEFMEWLAMFEGLVPTTKPNNRRSSKQPRRSVMPDAGGSSKSRREQSSNSGAGAGGGKRELPALPPPRVRTLNKDHEKASGENSGRGGPPPPPPPPAIEVSSGGDDGGGSGKAPVAGTKTQAPSLLSSIQNYDKSRLSTTSRNLSLSKKKAVPADSMAAILEQHLANFKKSVQDSDSDDDGEESEDWD